MNIWKHKNNMKNYVIILVKIIKIMNQKKYL